LADARRRIFDVVEDLLSTLRFRLRLGVRRLLMIPKSLACRSAPLERFEVEWLKRLKNAGILLNYRHLEAASDLQVRPDGILVFSPKAVTLHATRRH